VFSWKPADMPGVPQELIEHSLDVLKTAKLIKQKLRRFAQDKKEVYHPEWLANPILVRKRIMNGGCTLITLISTNTAIRTSSVCLI
jgi:hypothetical protein